MTLASPAALLLLLLALPLLLLLEALRRRLSVRPVASADLWRGLLRRPEGRSPGALAPLDLSAGLRAGALLLGVFGMAGPSVRSSGGGTLRIVVDRSASMAARASGGRSRLSLGVEGALRALEGLPGATPVLLERPPIDPGPLVTDLAEARRVLPALEPTDAPLDPRSVLAPPPEGGEALFVTDHVPEFVPLGVRVLALGPPAENCGFVAFEVEGTAGRGIAIWALLRNFSERTVEREVVAVGPHEVPLGRVALGPGEARALSARVEAAPVVGFRCLGTDALAADDAVLSSPGTARLRARVGPEVPGAVLRALAAAGDLEIVEGPPEVGVDPPDLEVGRSEEGSARWRIVLDALRGEPFEATGIRFLPPLPEEIDLSGVRTGPVRGAPEGGRPILLARAADGAQRPIAVEDERGWTLYFDPSAGNWREHPSFPVFFAVAVERARDRAGRFGFARAGERLPDLPSGAGRVGVFERPGRPPLCVNLLSPEESSLPGGTAEPDLPAPRGARGSALAPLAFLLAAAGVGVSLLLEARRG
ncbi:MAG TPA: hypothetical protein VFI25_11155 [Planctomycetota bacterium]|nr:hypothetical protein [Planctomycetota bacterium]